MAIQNQEITSDAKAPLLEVENLSIAYRSRGHDVPAVNGVSFSLGSGKILGLVGESGSGKSTIALALLGLVERNHGRIVGGSIRFDGVELLPFDQKRLQTLRRNDFGYIVQDPHSSLNPLLTIGTQSEESVFVERSQEGRKRRAVEALEQLGLSHAADHWKAYPYELSGGMKQRVVGGFAIANRPRLIIADEPTTALDLTVQAQYLRRLHELRSETGLSIVLITHDMGVVAEMCDDVMVLRNGRCVESGTTEKIFDNPQEEYTQQLIEAAGLRRATGYKVTTKQASEGPAVAEFKDVSKIFAVKRGRAKYQVRAVNDLNLQVSAGETLALVGESGCGKSTTGRLLLGLTKSNSGEVILTNNQGDSGRKKTTVRAVFQNPRSSLNPRRRIGSLILESMRGSRFKGEEAAARVRQVIEEVGLEPEHANVLPSQLSGGQQQRAAIAAAIAAEPELIVLDEPTSALDATIGARVATLLSELQDRLGCAYLLITHDIHLARKLSNRTVVMYLGSIVESGETEQVLSAPVHPYTRSLLAAEPCSHPRDRGRTELPRGEIASALDRPSGCSFHPRCPKSDGKRCVTEEPRLIKLADISPGNAAGSANKPRLAACHYPILD